MGLTKPTAAMINFSIHNVTDPLVRINSGQTGTNDKDIGFVFERGDDANVALFWDETADQFVLVNTTEDGSTNGDVTVSSYADMQVGTVNASTLTVSGAVTFAVNNDQRLAFGMDNNSDFYITRRTGGSWYDDTFVIDRDTGLLSLGYGATVAGTLTYSTLNDGTTTLTSTVAELNYMDGVTSNVQTQLDAKAPTAGPTFTGTDGIVIPSGTTAQRPVSPATGTMRFNTTDGRFEGYNGTAWVPIDTLYS